MTRRRGAFLVLVMLAAGVAVAQQVERWYGTRSNGASIALQATDTGFLKVSGAGSNVPIAPDETEAAAAGNLKLWLKADAITGVADGGAVATWPDASGNAFDATEATNQPTLQTSEINGWPVVRFDGTNDNMEVAAGFNSATQNVAGITVLAVYETNADVLSRVIHIATGTGIARFLFGPASLLDLTAIARRADGDTAAQNTSTGDMGPLGTPLLQTAVVNYATNSFANYRTGTAFPTSPITIPGTSGANTSNTASSVVAAIGSNSTAASAFLNGDIAEVVMFNSALSDADRKGVEIYLACKYALTLSYTFVCPALDLDASNIVGLADGGSVVTWPDTSGNAFDAAAGAGITFQTAELNTRPVVRFDGTGSFSLSGGALGILNNVTGATALFVAKVDPAAASAAVLYAFSRGTDTIGRWTASSVIANRNIRVQRRRLDADGFTTVTSADNEFLVSTWYVSTSESDFSTARSRLWMNGASIGDATSGTPGNTSATNSVGARIGAAATDASRWIGDFAKAQVFVPHLSDVNRRAREAALCRKYGLTCQ